MRFMNLTQAVYSFLRASKLPNRSGQFVEMVYSSISVLDSCACVSKPTATSP